MTPEDAATIRWMTAWVRVCGIPIEGLSMVEIQDIFCILPPPSIGCAEWASRAGHEAAEGLIQEKQIERNSLVFGE